MLLCNKGRDKVSKPLVGEQSLQELSAFYVTLSMILSEIKALLEWHKWGGTRGAYELQAEKNSGGGWSLQKIFEE